MVASGLPGCQQVCPGCQVKNGIAPKRRLMAPRGGALSPACRVGRRHELEGHRLGLGSRPAQPAQVLLLWLAKRATDNGVCFPTKREIRQATGLSESMVRYHLSAWQAIATSTVKPSSRSLRIIERPIAGDRNTSECVRDPGAVGGPELVRAELEELKHMPSSALEGVGATVAPRGWGRMHCTQWVAPVHPRWVPPVARRTVTTGRHRDTPPIPPVTGQQQPGGCGGGNERDDASRAAPRADLDEPPGDNAGDLVVAFYRGLGADSTALTLTMRRRDLAIARQLVAAGATPAEAESYARDTCQMAGRIAPIDLRSFERERLGWLARRRGAEQARGRFVDRTGQPPSWQLPVPDNAGAATTPRHG